MILTRAILNWTRSIFAIYQSRICANKSPCFFRNQFTFTSRSQKTSPWVTWKKATIGLISRRPPVQQEPIKSSADCQRDITVFWEDRSSVVQSLALGSGNESPWHERFSAMLPFFSWMNPPAPWTPGLKSTGWNGFENWPRAEPLSSSHTVLQRLYELMSFM